MQWSIILLCLSVVAGMKTKLMYMKQSGLSDLKASASGYVYHGTSGGPVSYVQFSSVLPTLKPISQPVLSKFIKPLPIPIFLQERKAEENVASKEEVDSDEKDENYEEGTGEENDSGYHLQNGEKSVVDYDNKHAYDKGEKSSYDKENHQNHYLLNGGNKKGYHDSANAYQSNHEAGKGSEGENYSESGYHKKGQKTTGYHRVYHKDEYKKDHTFYDEADRRGHYEKYGQAQAERKAEAGSRKEGGKSDAGHQEVAYGRAGAADKGRSQEASAGHNNANGREQYEKKKDTFAANNGNKNARQYGYSVKEV